MKGAFSLLQHARDWFATYDPAQGNLRSAGRVLLSVALALAGIVLLGRLSGHPVMSLAIGVIIAMNTSSAARDPKPGARRVTMLLTPLPAALSVTLAAALSQLPYGGEVGFVVVTCAAVYIRRFGLRGFTFGMVAFMSYFFALFTRVQVAALPWVYGALLLGALCSLLGYLLIADPSRERLLAAALGAVQSRTRQLFWACREVVRTGAARQRRALERATTLLNESTLAASEQVAAFSDGSGAAALTAQLLDLELSAQRVAEASSALPEAERAAALGELDRLARWSLAGRTTRLWQHTSSERTPFHRALSAFGAALATLSQFETERLELAAQAAPPSAPPPASSIVTPIVSPTEMRPSTRQALQAALACSLAIVGGELISPARWYWAVITAFIVFTGTSTRGEVFVKGWQRVLGTLAGVAGGVLLATLLQGDVAWSLALIVLSIFLGFYLIRLSYALMIFHITIMLALFYGLTGTFTPGLLELRLAETAYGAVAGMLAAAFFLPTQTRGRMEQESRAFFQTLSALLGDVAASFRPLEPDTSPAPDKAVGSDAHPLASSTSRRALELDRHFQLLRSAARPLTRNPFRGSWRQSVGRHLQLVLALNYEVDQLLYLLRVAPAEPGDSAVTAPLAEAAAALQERCLALAEARVPERAAPPAPLAPEADPRLEAVAEQLGRLGKRLSSLEQQAAAGPRTRQPDLSPAS